MNVGIPTVWVILATFMKVRGLQAQSALFQVHAQPHELDAVLVRDKPFIAHLSFVLNLRLTSILAWSKKRVAIALVCITLWWVFRAVSSFSAFRVVTC